MTELILVKKGGPYQIFQPADKQSWEVVGKLKDGEQFKVKIQQHRNPRFHRKMMALFGLAYDHFVQHGISEIEYKGQIVKPSFDRFRKDLTILAGHYTPVFRVDGEIRLEAKSLSFGKCSEEEAEKIYSDVIDAILRNVYKHVLYMDEATLRERVEEVLRFA